MINLALEVDASGSTSRRSTSRTLLGMGIVQGLSLAPVAFIMTAVVFRSMDPSLDEAASIGGANLWQTLCRVTVPLAWPGVLAASIYVFTIGFAAFDVPAILGLTQPDLHLLDLRLLQVTPTDGLPEYGGVAALSVFMVVLGGGAERVVRPGAGAGAALRGGHRQGLSPGAHPARPLPLAGDRFCRAPISC